MAVDECDGRAVCTEWAALSGHLLCFNASGFQRERADSARRVRDDGVVAGRYAVETKQPVGVGLSVKPAFTDAEHYIVGSGSGTREPSGNGVTVRARKNYTERVQEQGSSKSEPDKLLGVSHHYAELPSR